MPVECCTIEQIPAQWVNGRARRILDGAVNGAIGQVGGAAGVVPAKR